MQIPGTKIKVTASRWPWMRRKSVGLLEFDAKVGDKYGWRRNSTMGRFGGGFQWNLGVHIGRYTVILELLFGSIKIGWYEPKSDEETETKG